MQLSVPFSTFNGTVTSSSTMGGQGRAGLAYVLSEKDSGMSPLDSAKNRVERIHRGALCVLEQSHQSVLFGKVCPNQGSGRWDLCNTRAEYNHMRDTMRKSYTVQESTVSATL